MTDESREPFKRLFFALDCAPAQRKAIAQWRSALQLRIGRPVPAENFHLTLKFLGSVAIAQIADICDAAASVRTSGERLTVVLDRLDVWRRAGALVLAPRRRQTLSWEKTGQPGLRTCDLAVLPRATEMPLPR